MQDHRFSQLVIKGNAIALQQLMLSAVLCVKKFGPNVWPADINKTIKQFYYICSKTKHNEFLNDMNFWLVHQII